MLNRKEIEKWGGAPSSVECRRLADELDGIPSDSLKKTAERLLVERWCHLAPQDAVEFVLRRDGHRGASSVFLDWARTDAEATLGALARLYPGDLEGNMGNYDSDFATMAFPAIREIVRQRGEDAVPLLRRHGMLRRLYDVTGEEFLFWGPRFGSMLALVAEELWRYDPDAAMRLADAPYGLSPAVILRGILRARARQLGDAWAARLLILNTNYIFMISPDQFRDACGLLVNPDPLDALAELSDWPSDNFRIAVAAPLTRSALRTNPQFVIQWIDQNYRSSDSLGSAAFEMALTKVATQDSDLAKRLASEIQSTELKAIAERTLKATTGEQ